MAEYRSEYVSGKNYEILREGNCVHGGTYNILNAGPRLILTIPKDSSSDVVADIMGEVYSDHQWGVYYLKRTKRWCIAVSDLDQDKLEGCAKKL
jgi:hypothetical protein